MSDLSIAACGDRLVREGVEYVVIGRYNQPCVLLQRADAFDLPIPEHTRLAVVPTSLWAAQWKRL